MPPEGAVVVGADARFASLRRPSLLPALQPSGSAGNPSPSAQNDAPVSRLAAEVTRSRPGLEGQDVDADASPFRDRHPQRQERRLQSELDGSRTGSQSSVLSEIVLPGSQVPPLGTLPPPHPPLPAPRKDRGFQVGFSTQVVGFSIQETSCLIFSICRRSAAISLVSFCRLERNTIHLIYVIQSVIDFLFYGYFLFSYNTRASIWDASTDAARGQMNEAILVSSLLLVRFSLTMFLAMIAASQPLLKMLSKAFQTWFVLQQTGFAGICNVAIFLVGTGHDSLALMGAFRAEELKPSFLYITILPIISSLELLLSDALIPPHHKPLLSGTPIAMAVYLVTLLASVLGLGFYSSPVEFQMKLELGSVVFPWTPRGNVIGASLVLFLLCVKNTVSQFKTQGKSLNVLRVPFTISHFDERSKKGGRGKKGKVSPDETDLKQPESVTTPQADPSTGLAKSEFKSKELLRPLRSDFNCDVSSRKSDPADGPDRQPCEEDGEGTQRHPLRTRRAESGSMAELGGKISRRMADEEVEGVRESYKVAAIAIIRERQDHELARRASGLFPKPDGFRRSSMSSAGKMPYFPSLSDLVLQAKSSSVVMSVKSQSGHSTSTEMAGSRGSALYLGGGEHAGRLEDANPATETESSLPLMLHPLHQAASPTVIPTFRPSYFSLVHSENLTLTGWATIESCTLGFSIYITEEDRLIYRIMFKKWAQRVYKFFRRRRMLLNAFGSMVNLIALALNVPVLLNIDFPGKPALQIFSLIIVFPFTLLSLSIMSSWFLLFQITRSSEFWLFLLNSLMYNIGMLLSVTADITPLTRAYLVIMLLSVDIYLLACDTIPAGFLKLPKVFVSLCSVWSSSFIFISLLAGVGLWSKDGEAQRARFDALTGTSLWNPQAMLANAILTSLVMHLRLVLSQLSTRKNSSIILESDFFRREL